eukprot:TRINITY_DN4386_c0_g2_i1.p1 TRINITY_DN4386_c0_g2~~TRINITY_DN4386_c0_g2_i1.p1  ORF type:complete len:174 (+),score=37.34 TRINITY_DN4386_c0_g2_i1:40-522(+)
MSLNVRFESWADFAKDLKVPGDSTVAQNRMKSNLRFWLWNYLSIEALFVLIMCYFYRWLFVVLAVVGGTGAALFYVRTDSLKIGNTVVNNTHKQIALVAELLLGLWLTETTTALAVGLAFGTVLVLAHAAAKSEPSVAAKVKKTASNAFNDTDIKSKLSH